MFEYPAIASIAMIVVALLEWMDYLFAAPPAPVLYTMVAGAIVAFTIWRFYCMRRHVKALRLAVDGERAVGQFLERFRQSGYQVFHDMLGTGFNVDHVLIGPAGVFTMETKTWSKPTDSDARIMFDGESVKYGSNTPDRDPVTQALAQASWLRALLQESTGKVFHVWPVILFPGWFVEQLPGSKRRVWVLEPKALPGFIDKEPRRLSDEDAKLASFHLSRFIRASQTQS